METFKELPILIVDDDENIHELYRAVLKRHGFRNVHTARSGSETLELLGVPRPGDNAVQDCEFPLTTGTDAAVDLVILDVILPDINGFDVCRWIKHALSPFLPIILVSGYDHVRGIEAGADYFVAKPINFDEFIAKVSMLLERKFQYNTQITSISSSRDETLPENAFPVVGDRLGDFEIEATLGWGGSTVIYRARNTVDNETYAIKILAHHAAEEEEVADRFEREICMMQSVIHHNIIRVHSTGRSGVCPWYAMELVDGKTLDGLLEESPLDTAFFTEVAMGVATALAAIHEHNIIHRDIKPKNVFACRTGGIKLGDFGVAVDLSSTRLTQAGHSVGTPIYMAPEQFEGSKVSTATDIYSFGATMYHAMTGRPPFEASNAMELMRRHFTDTAKPISEIRFDIPAAWDHLIIDQCMAKQPGDRPQSMQSVIESMDALLQGS